MGKVIEVDITGSMAYTNVGLVGRDGYSCDRSCSKVRYVWLTGDLTLTQIFGS